MPQVIKEKVLEHLMLPTPEPRCFFETNEDLLDCVLDCRAALERSNTDKAAFLRSMEQK